MLNDNYRFWTKKKIGMKNGQKNKEIFSFSWQEMNLKKSENVNQMKIRHQQQYSPPPPPV